MPQSIMLADVILVIHFLFVLFVVGSLPFIWLGAWLGLAVVRNVWFRLIHLSAILFVVGESLIGVACPLTSWEDSLRGTVQDENFVQRWLHQVIFYDVPEGVLTVVYLLFAALVAITFWLFPPRLQKSRL